MDLMTLEDAPFVFGVFIAPLIALAVFTIVVATSKPRRMIFAVSVLSAVVVGSLVTYWATWGMAFDELDAGREVSSATDLAANISIGTSAVAAALLLALGVMALVTAKSRNNPTVEFGNR